MPITAITVAATADFADGHEFGKAGAYVRVHGVAHGVLDPNAAENAGIVDLDKAPRNAAGLVEYATDFDILRPRDMRRGNGILVYDVPNRGSKRIFNLLDDVPANDPARTNDPKTREDAGLGFCLGRGYALVWSGWDPGAPRANAGLGGDFPVALENGQPITGRIRDEFHIGTRAPATAAATACPTPPRPSTSRRRGSSCATARATRAAKFRAANGSSSTPRTIRLLPEGRKFEPFRIYELWYEATEPKVLGIGFASVRDLVSFLRYERDGNPLCGRRRGPSCARLRGVAERPLPAPFPRTRDEPGQRRAARVRRRAEPCRRRRQGVRQPPLRNARPHRDTARGPAFSGKLVPVQHGPVARTRSAAAPAASCRPRRAPSGSSKPTARPSIGRREPR